MQITYLLANYNNGRHIRDCLDSLQAQTDPNWLCLIADDASTDGSLNLLKKQSVPERPLPSRAWERYGRYQGRLRRGMQPVNACLYSNTTPFFLELFERHRVWLDSDARPIQRFLDSDPSRQVLFDFQHFR